MKNQKFMTVAVAVIFASLFIIIGALNVSAQTQVADKYYNSAGRTVYSGVSFTQVGCEPGSTACIDGKQQGTAGDLGIAGATYFNELTRGLVEKKVLRPDEVVAYDGDDLANIWLPNCHILVGKHWAMRPNRLKGPPAQKLQAVATIAPTPAPAPSPLVINITNVMPEQQQQQQQQQQTLVVPAPTPVVVAKKKGPCNPEGKLKRFLSAVGYAAGGAGIGRATEGEWGPGAIIGGIGGGVGGAVLGPCYGGLGSLAGLSGFAFQDDGKNPYSGIRGGRENENITWTGDFVPATTNIPNQVGPPLVMGFTLIGSNPGGTTSTGFTGNGNGPRP